MIEASIRYTHFRAFINKAHKISCNGCNTTTYVLQFILLLFSSMPWMHSHIYMLVLHECLPLLYSEYKTWKSFVVVHKNHISSNEAVQFTTKKYISEKWLELELIFFSNNGFVQVNCKNDLSCIIFQVFFLKKDLSRALWSEFVVSKDRRIEKGR